jgi:starvation-inducible DNA-binding protein
LLILKETLLKVNIGLTEKQLKQSSDWLNILLGDEYLLYTKTRNYHWNVEGQQFHSRHLFFEEQYKELDEIIDATAERVRNLGHYAAGTMNAFLEKNDLSERKGQQDAAMMISNLLKDHETIIQKLRTGIELMQNKFKDAGTSDFITGILGKHEKMAWMLRANLN